MDIQEILDELATVGDTYKRDVIDAAIAQQAEITPHLIALLETVRDQPEQYANDDTFYGHIHAAMLLTEFQSAAAHPALVDLFSLPSPWPEKLFGDLITETLPMVLLRTCNGSLDRIWQLAENSEADPFCRGSATQAMIYGVVEGLISRETLLSQFEALFKTADPSQVTEASREFYSQLAYNCCDLWPQEIMDTVNWAFEQAVVTQDFLLDIEDFTEAIALGKEGCLQRLAETYERRAWTHIHDEMQPWAYIPSIPSDLQPWPPSLNQDPLVSLPPSPSVPPLYKPAKKKKKKKAFWDLSGVASADPLESPDPPAKPVSLPSHAIPTRTLRSENSFEFPCLSMKMGSCRRHYLVLSLLLLWGLWLWLGASNGAVAVQSLVIEVGPGQAIAARLYRPAQAEASLPALLLCHGVSSSKDTLAPLAWELARHGMAAVVFDFGGYGQSYRRPNAQAANLQEAAGMMQWMRQQPQFDPQRLGIVGHSMGGTTALELAKANPDLNPTIVLGIGGVASPESPANLLFGSGVYEELNPVARMVAMFAVAAGEPVPPFQTVGDFAQGTARRLVFSPTVDHMLAPYDTALHRAGVDWARRSLNVPNRPGPFLAQRRIWGQVLSGIAIAGLALGGYLALVQRGGRWAIGMAGGGLLAIWLWGPAGVGSGIMTGGLAVMLLGNYIDRYPRAGVAARRGLLYGGLLYSLVLLTIVLNAIATGSLLAMPQAIGGIPALAISLLFNTLCDRFHLVRYFLLSGSGLCLFLTLSALETHRPGLILGQLGTVANRVIRFIRQPLVWQGHGVSRRTLLLLPLLLAILTVILYQQYRAGLLNWDAASLALRLVGMFVVLPGAVGVLVVRSHPFCHLEQRLGGTSQH